MYDDTRDPVEIVEEIRAGTEEVRDRYLAGEFGWADYRDEVCRACDEILAPGD